MRRDELERVVRAEPFQPFRQYVLENAAYETHHPEMIALGQHTVTVHVPNPAIPMPVAGRQFIISMIHISRIEMLPPAGSNGH
jgi:hypothetical protein